MNQEIDLSQHPMHTPYDDLVAAYAAALKFPEPELAGDLAPISTTSPAADAPICLIFSPHPDDECLSGALALRLRHQHGWRVINCAVTLGSKPERRAERWQEVQAACDYLGFELITPSGTAGVALEREQLEPASVEAITCIARILQTYQPRVVICPHALDGHPVHIGVQHLVQKAMAHAMLEQPCHVLQSEYWNTQIAPHLMLELEAGQVVQLVTATSLHKGEVARNPYHRTLPAWFIDGARRGAERVGLAGSAHTGMAFAALYGWEVWDAGFATNGQAQVAPFNTALDVLF
jgi:LmbE family N-acetylglucosaminyl deacetylase